MQDKESKETWQQNQVRIFDEKEEKPQVLSFEEKDQIGALVQQMFGT